MNRSDATQLFERHRPAMLRYLYRMTGDGALAEDLCQEVFVRVLRGAGRYEERHRQEAWLFTIARNLTRDDRRRRARRPRCEELDEATTSVSINPRQHLSTSIGEALSAIDDIEREAFLLRELGGLGYREIAEVVGATPDAVRSRIHRARLALREQLAAPLTRVRKLAYRETRS